MTVGTRLTADQLTLRDALRDLLAHECSASHVLEHWRGKEAVDGRLWQSLSVNGWLGLCSAESVGGAGLGVIELAMVSEEFGRVSGAAPFVPSLLASLILRESGLETAVAAGLAEGALKIALGLSEDGLDMESSPLRQTDGNQGRAAFLPWAGAADIILLPIGDRRIVLVPSKHVTLRSRPTLDIGMPLSEVEILAPEAGARETIECSHARLLDLSRVTMAAEMLGAMRRCLELSLDYAGIRKQFGRPIGSFQAVRHMCADMATEIENTESVVQAAAFELSHAATTPLATVAKLQANRASRIVWTNALQIHAGIGFTWEFELHLPIKRLMSLQGLGGSSASLSLEAFNRAHA